MSNDKVNLTKITERTPAHVIDANFRKLQLAMKGLRQDIYPNSEAGRKAHEKLQRYMGDWSPVSQRDSQSYTDQQMQQALDAASAAQSTADGKITAYYQTTAPDPSTVVKGDLWFDTDDGNHCYYFDGTAWADNQDSAISEALNSANDAQATADKKVNTYFSTTTPTASAVGDLWYNSTNHELSRWDGTSWVGPISDITQYKTSANTAKVNNTDAATVEANASNGALANLQLQIRSDAMNLAPNPMFDGGSNLYWDNHVSVVAGTSAGVPTGAPTGYVGVQNQRDAYGSDYFMVNEGDSYYIECWASSDANVNTSYDWGIGLNTQDASGTNKWTRAVSLPSGASKPWQKISGFVTIPSGHVKARLWTQDSEPSGTTDTGNYYFTKIRVFKVIEAYAIAADSLSAITANLGSITAGDIKGVSITGSTFDASGADGATHIDDTGWYIADTSGIVRIGVGLKSSSWNQTPDPGQLTFFSNASGQINPAGTLGMNNGTLMLMGGSPDIVNDIQINGKSLTLVSGSAIKMLGGVAPAYGWQPLTTQNGWGQLNATSYPCQYMKLANGMVLLSGLLNAGTDNTIAFTLPSDACPASTTYRVVLGYNGSSYQIGRAIINPSGTVNLSSPGFSWISIGGAAFYAG